MERLVGTYIFDPELTAGKMIFLSGPRQVGKTIFAQAWLKSAGSEETYFNWDDPSVMLAYTRNPYPASQCDFRIWPTALQSPTL